MNEHTPEKKTSRHFLSINHSAPGNVFTGTSFPSCHSISQLRKNITACSLLSFIFYPCNELIEHPHVPPLGQLLACTCVPARPSPRSNFSVLCSSSKTSVHARLCTATAHRPTLRLPGVKPSIWWLHPGHSFRRTRLQPRRAARWPPSRVPAFYTR